MRTLKIQAFLLAIVAAVIGNNIPCMAAARNGAAHQPQTTQRKPLLPKRNARGAATTSLTTPSSPALEHLRGGATAKVKKALSFPKIVIDDNLKQALSGIVVLAAIEYGCKVLFKELDISFPPMLGGCVGLFGSLVLWERLISKKQADQVASFLTPAALLLAKWLPMFFVPGLALLPQSPSVGGPIEAVKVLAVVVLGMIYTLVTVGATASAIRGTGGLTLGSAKQLNKVSRATTTTKPKPFTERQVLTCGTVAAVLAVGTLLTQNSEWNKVFETACLTLGTVTSFMWASRLPAKFTSVVHPLVTCCGLTCVALIVLGFCTNRSLDEILRGYKMGRLSPWKHAGSGDVLLYMLGPTAVSFSISMYGKRHLLAQNLWVVGAAVIVSSVGGLFGTAAFVRLIRLGSNSVNARTLRLSVLSRNVTTALALALTNVMGGDLSLAAAVVCLTGVIGATYGKAILNYFGIKDGITRGLCIGASAQGLGVASMADEPDAFSFAAMAMVLTAVTSTTLVTFPSVKHALVKLATGRKF